MLIPLFSFVFFFSPSNITSFIILSIHISPFFRSFLLSPLLIRNRPSVTPRLLLCPSQPSYLHWKRSNSAVEKFRLYFHCIHCLRVARYCRLIPRRIPSAKSQVGRLQKHDKTLPSSYHISIYNVYWRLHSVRETGKERENPTEWVLMFYTGLLCWTQRYYTLS